MSDANGFANGILVRPPRPRPGHPLASQLDGRERPADDQRRERVCYLPVGRQVGLHVLPHRERHVRMADARAQGLPVDLGITARRGVAVANVVQVDPGQSGRLGEPVEPARDRVRVRRLTFACRATKLPGPLSGRE
jgi:hypothetical protein